MNRRRLRRKLRKVLRTFGADKAQEGEEIWISHHRGKITEIPIREMQDKHLLNAILFLESHAAFLHATTIQQGCSFFESLRGKQVLYNEEQIRQFKKLKPEQFLAEQTVYPALHREAQRRGLAVPPLAKWGN